MSDRRGANLNRRAGVSLVILAGVMALIVFVTAGTAGAADLVSGARDVP